MSPTLTNADRLLRLSVAAKRLGGWTPKTIRRWIKRGKIQATKAPNGHWLIAESEVQRCQENISSPDAPTLAHGE